MIAKEFYSQFSETQLDALRDYLSKRYQYKKARRKFGIVYDVSHLCNLACRGCGTNAIYTPLKKVNVAEPTINQIETAFKKIKEYSQKANVPVFINIGGGEPFLRADIIDVIRLASEYFGVDGVGVDTNGTLKDSSELISQVLEYVSYVGISINGLEEYHNWWVGNESINAFKRSIAVVENLCSTSIGQTKVEVTSVATKKNLNDLPALMSELKRIGVQKYSIHRAIPVGRMANLIDIVPSASEYLRLLLSIIEQSRLTGLAVHLHHSIESIHETLLLGYNTYVADKVGNPDMESSLGIEPEGHLVFDPWCTVGVWKQLSSGNIYDETTDFLALLSSNNGTLFDLSKIYTTPHLRCGGCPNACSGGSRIAAASYVINRIAADKVNISDILAAMTAKDPACPLYVNDEDK